jgi:hypothetical protein
MIKIIRTGGEERSTEQNLLSLEPSERAFPSLNLGAQ